MAATELTEPPSMWVLNAKAAASVVPGASRLPFLAPAGGDLPPLELALADVAIDRAHLAAYRRVCGFGARDELPGTYPHVLAFPLHLAILTDRRFPFPAVGLVHYANRITQHRPIRFDERLSFRVRTTGLERHPKGRSFELLSEAHVSDELVWEDKSTILRREPSDESESGEGATDDRGWPASAQWRVERSIGRRYAAVSGDRNPIHVTSVAARLSGFPSVIAPGMWTKARSLAALEAHSPNAYTVDVRFERPIPLPASVAFGSRRDGRGREFAVHDEQTGKPHLTGTIEPAW